MERLTRRIDHFRTDLHFAGAIAHGYHGLFGIALLHSHRKNHVGHDFLGECFQLFKQNHTGHITHPIHSKLV